MMENRYGKDRGLYYFSRGQLVILGLAFMATSVLIFLLGVLIGQRIEERKLVKKEGPLVKIPVQRLPPGSSSRGAAKEEMTFYETLSKAPARTQPAPAESAKETKAAEKPVKPAAEETSGGDVTAPSAEKTAQPVKGEAQKPVWTVQVNAFPIEKPAQGLVAKLREKGYDAYMTTASIKGKTWYRVRVGRFSTREKAKELQDVLATKENLTHAISVSR